MTRPITRREFVGAATGSALATAACVAPSVGGTPYAGAPGRDDLVIDTSAPMLSPTRGFAAFRDELRARQLAGFDAAVVPVAIRDGMEGTLRNLLALSSHVAQLSEEAVLVSRPDLLHVGPRFGIIPIVQGLNMIGEQVHLIPQLRDAGVLVMQLTGYWKNWCGDGCLERGDNPLTGLGRMVVRRIAEAGAVLDLAAAGLRTSLEALEIASGPVIVSRANAAAVHAHPQNLTDAQIDGIKQADGVIGVTAFPALLSGAARPSVEDLLRHLRYLADHAGVEHLAIGLDFDDRARRRFPEDPLPNPPYAYPTGLASVGDVQGFRQRLEREGFSEVELDGLFGGNLVRLLNRAVQAKTG